jgi:hypothetical protein
MKNELAEIRNKDEFLAALINHPPSGETFSAQLNVGDELHVDTGLGTVLGSGWSDLEEWGVWTDGRRATINLTVHNSVPVPFNVVLTLRGYLSKDGTQTLGVVLQGRCVATAVFTPQSGDVVLRVAVSEEQLNGSQSLEMELRISNPTPPAALTSVEDYRELGVGLMRLQIL